MSLLNPQDLIDKFNHDIESDVVYTSTTGNIHTLYASLVSKSVNDAYISKIGDIPNTDTHYKGSNSAVYAENNNGKYTVTNSSIKTNGLGADATTAYNNGAIELTDTDVLTIGDLSAGLLASTNATSTANGISLYTLGEDSNAVYINTDGSVNISDSYIGSDKAVTAYIDQGGDLYIENTTIFNNEDNFIIDVNGRETSISNINIVDTIIDKVSPVLHIKDTNKSLCNDIKFINTLFTSPSEEKYAFDLENTNTKITLVNSSSANGIGNLLNAVKTDVVIDASTSNLSGNVIADDDSTVSITLGHNTKFVGSVNGKNTTVKLTKAIWELTEDISIAELDIDYTSIIVKNDHLLLIDGEDYTDGVTIGSVVHYTTKAEKVYDREIIERNCIVIKKLFNEEGANEFILYDADDRLAYKALYSEFRDTGKTVDIGPILEDIEDLLIGIDEYYSDSTIRTKDENTNAIVINGKVYSLDNIIVEKYNDAADETRGLEGENAAILVENGGELNLTGSTVVSDGDFATGIMVRDESRLTLDTVSIETNDKNSPGIFAIDGSYASVENSEITTNIIDGFSTPIVIMNSSKVETTDSIITSHGKAPAVYINNQSIEGHDVINIIDTEFTDTGSTFNADLSDKIISAVVSNSTEDGKVIINLKDSKINTDTENTSIRSLIKCNGINTPDTIDINLNNVEFINPPESEAFVNIDPCTVNFYLDATSTFTQLNDEGYLFKVESDSVLNLTANFATVNGQIKLEDRATVNFEMYSCVFNGLFNSEEQKGEVNVKMVNSVWNMSSDDYIYSLDIDANSTINTNGHYLFINGRVFNPETEVNDQYQEIEVPTGRVLKVLTSNEYSALTTKSESYIYFLYDKLEMWFEHSQFISPFCIVERLPEDPTIMAPDILYISYITGKLYIYNDYVVKEVGYVEHDSFGKSDPNQLTILASAGTTYFHNAESRYIDTQTRTIILPYQNGSYQICVNIPEDLKIDENTVVYYNPESGQWEVDGYRTSSEFEIPYYNNIKAANSSTVLTNIINKNIVRSDLRISNKSDNLINAAVNGIYVDGSKLVTNEDYRLLKDTIMNYRSIADAYMLELRTAVLETIGVVSMDVIEEKILNALRGYESTIDRLLADYNTIYNRLRSVEEFANNRLDAEINSAKQEILDYLDNLSNPWKIFAGDIVKPSLTPEELHHIADALAYGRSKIVEVADGHPIKYVEDLPTNPDDIISGTIYAIWNEWDEFYILSIWNAETEAWDPWDTGVTPVMPNE